MEADVTHSVMLFNDCILWHFSKKNSKNRTSVMVINNPCIL